ncbi:hypothetical protein Trydic_g13258 [Trypoxylus dichotomus]
MFQEDTCEYKLNLGIGSLKNESGDPWVFPTVKHAKKSIAADEALDKEYLPSLGLESFTNAATELLLGNDSQPMLEGRVFAVQAMSGTGGLRIAAELLCKHLGYKTCYVSNPGWKNHTLIFKSAGFVEVQSHRYWKESTKTVDIEGMLEDLRNARTGAIVILHVCTHNPTGCDPTEEQWIQIANVLKEKKLFPILDCVFQGMASGDLDKDVWPVRYFASVGFELFCCQSFHCFGLCNERVGNLVCIVKDPEVIKSIKSRLTSIVRTLYSAPPAHGARIITYILNNPLLYEEWRECIRRINDRLVLQRRGLREHLEKLETRGNWEHITRQKGMYLYTGLTKAQCTHMAEVYRIYMAHFGRMNLSEINATNIDLVTRAIHDTVQDVPSEE